MHTFPVPERTLPSGQVTFSPVTTKPPLFPAFHQGLANSASSSMILIVKTDLSFALAHCMGSTPRHLSILSTFFSKQFSISSRLTGVSSPAGVLSVVVRLPAVTGTSKKEGGGMIIP